MQHTHISNVATEGQRKDLYKKALISWSNLEILIPDKNCICKIKHLGKGLAFLHTFLETRNKKQISRDTVKQNLWN